MRALHTFPVRVEISPYKLTVIQPYLDLFGRSQERTLTYAIEYYFGWAICCGKDNWVTVESRSEAVRMLRGIGHTAAQS